MRREKERFIALGFAFVLAAVFIAYLGPVITGSVVKDNEDVTLADFPYPFIKNNVVNNVVIVVADRPSTSELVAAHEVSLIFDMLLGVRPEIRAESSVQERTQNRIIIGKRCSDVIVRAAGEALCNRDLAASTGVIVLVQKQDAFDLLISGSDDIGVRLAANLVSMYKNTRLGGMDQQVQE